MKTRNAKTKVKDVTPAQYEQAMQKYAGAEQREAEINNCIETEVNEILHNYEDELTCLAQVKNTAFEIVQSYCIENKDRLFTTRRSIGTPYGVTGFRLGSPRLKTAKGVKWDSVVEKLQSELPGYVRTVYEPARDMLIADRHSEQVAPVLVQLGLEVVQDELFYIESKKAA